MDELNQRVIKVLEASALTKSAFALKLDLSLPLLTHIHTGRNKPGLDLLQKILMHYPDISPDWLLLGNGVMYRQKSGQINLNSEINELRAIMDHINHKINALDQVITYHQILKKELSYLADLDELIVDLKQTNKDLANNYMLVLESIGSKVKNQ